MRVRQAGAIVYQSGAGEPRFLLVRAKKNPQDWIFPKGHVEPGETEVEAARRELREEAGVEGNPVAPVGTSEFQSGSEQVHVAYYLFRYSATCGSSEGRECRWCTFDEALALLSFEDAKRLLRIARPLTEWPTE